MRLLVVDGQCNSFATLEYDLTYHHDQARCRQHCHDMMQLLRAKPGLAIQHEKIPAMLRNTTSLVEVKIRGEHVVSSADQLQFILDHHRIVPPPIRKVDEDFCLALWPLILGRCSILLTQDHEDASSSEQQEARRLHSRERQASVLYKIFQDWSLMILLQGDQDDSMR